MRSVRIIHTGDLHLDSPYRGLPPVSAMVRKEEQRLTFARIIEETKAFEADALFLSGDLFDREYVSAQTVAFLQDCFQRIADTAVFIAPGNHDYRGKDSVYQTIDFGKNVHVFGPELSVLTYRNTRIFGYGFSERFVTESALSAFQSGEDDLPGIMVIHGDVSKESDYNPITEKMMEASGLEYIALGHIHTFSGFLRAGKTTYAYCGIPEGRYFDEAARGGFIRGVIEKGKADMEFVPIAKRQNQTIYVDVSGVRTHETAITKIKEMISSKQDLYKIVLTGTLDKEINFQTELLEKALSAECFFCKVSDETETYRETAEKNGALYTLFVRNLEGYPASVKKRAMLYGIAALEGRDILCE